MRVKRGTTKKSKHNKVLKSTKGYRLSYNNLYRRAKEAMAHAGQYSYAHRRRRKSQKRTEWIKIISAGLVGTDLTYGEFINKLNKSDLGLNRKMLSELAIENPEQFAKIVEGLK